jgi:starch synthase
MHYGTVPIVHGVGGLKDSVDDGQNGIVFDEYSSKALKEAVDRSIEVYIGQKRFEMGKAALNEDFSWDRSAKEYKNLYQKIIDMKG